MGSGTYPMAIRGQRESQPPGSSRSQAGEHDQPQVLVCPPRSTSTELARTGLTPTHSLEWVCDTGTGVSVCGHRAPGWSKSCDADPDPESEPEPEPAGVRSRAHRSTHPHLPRISTDEHTNTKKKEEEVWRPTPPLPPHQCTNPRNSDDRWVGRIEGTEGHGQLPRGCRTYLDPFLSLPWVRKFKLLHLTLSRCEHALWCPGVQQDMLSLIQTLWSFSSFLFSFTTSTSELKRAFCSICRSPVPRSTMAAETVVLKVRAAVPIGVPGCGRRGRASA